MSRAAADSAAGRKKLMLRVARLRREKRIRFWRVFAVSSFFVVALGADVYVGAVVMTDNFGAAFKPGKLTPPERTAQIRRPLLGGTFCRNITFDNQTAQSVEDRVERCDSRPPQPTATVAAPKRSPFTWGR